jgi:hypothetical protein
MKVRKNLEAVFLAASVMATFAAYATAEVPARLNSKPAIVAQAASDSNMQVVVIKGERMTAAEKAAQN